MARRERGPCGPCGCCRSWKNDGRGISWPPRIPAGPPPRQLRGPDPLRAKDTGLRNLPLHGYDQNQIWCEIVALACELLAWTAILALTGTGRQWGPKKLRLRLFSIAGRLVRGGRRVRLRLAARWPRTRDIAAAISRLQALAPG